MKPVSLSTIASACGGTLVGADSGVRVCHVSTDSRASLEGALFVALRGERFDGHDFVHAALEQGAVAVMLDGLPEEALDQPVVLVKDTLQAMQRLAHWYRRQLGIPVVAITGSNGKTSVKDFTASVLSQRFKVNATRGNLNNHIGLPLSVLSTEVDDEVGIWEMGMNHAGEIAPLCEIAAPDIGIITNIGTAHIEFLGSREGIAEEKSALARSLSERGTLIVSADCDFADYLIDHTHGHAIVTGNGRGSVRAEQLEMDAAGSRFLLCIDGENRVPVRIQVAGKHMVGNALLAAAAGHRLGMKSEEIAAGLEAAVLTSGRLRQYLYHGISVIDDTYNANPDSVVAAIDTLADLPQPGGAQKTVVLGMMAELGVHAGGEHHRVGGLAAQKGLRVVSVGEGALGIHQGASAEGARAWHFNDSSEAAEWLHSHSQTGDAVLFKGSRMAAMEKVMQQAFPQTDFDLD